METQKTIWRSICIPEPLFKAVKEMIVRTGNVSVAEYVRFAVMKCLQHDKDLLEELRLENERTRI